MWRNSRSLKELLNCDCIVLVLLLWFMVTRISALQGYQECLAHISTIKLNRFQLIFLCEILETHFILSSPLKFVKKLYKSILKYAIFQKIFIQTIFFTFY